MARLSDDRLRIVAHNFALVCGAALSLYLLWGLDDWLPALISGAGTICASLPLYARHLIRFEAQVERETDEKLTAHRIATDHYLQRERDKDARLLNVLMDQLEDTQGRMLSAEARAEAAEARLPKRDARGKFAKSQSGPLLIEHRPPA